MCHLENMKKLTVDFLSNRAFLSMTKGAQIRKLCQFELLFAINFVVMAQDIITPYLNTKESIYAVGITVLLAATTPRGH